MTHNNPKDKTMEFFEQAKKMMHNSKMNTDLHITPENVFQEAHKANRQLLFEIMKLGHLPGSTILGVENLKKLYQLAKEGNSCLVLSEHLSNMDVPSLFTRCYDAGDPELEEIFEKFIFIAGAKLNQTPLVKLYTEMFTRVVIYAVRSLKKIQDDPDKKEEVELAKKINMKATKKILELKNKGYIFVLYPTGTRYREWDESSKKGMKETMTYLNTFDYICCCSINGNNMPPKEHEDMTREQFLQDVIVFNFGEVIKTEDFIEAVKKKYPDINEEDKDAVRQSQVDEVMNIINDLHNEAEKYRKKFLN